MDSEKMSGSYRRLSTALVIALMVTVALCAGSCKAKREMLTNERVVTVTERDTTILTEPDSCALKALLRCDSLGNVYINELFNIRDSLKNNKTSAKGNRNAKLNLNIKNNVLEADCECDTMAILATVRDSTIMSKDVLTVYKEREFKWYETFLMGSGMLSWAILLLVICKKRF